MAQTSHRVLPSKPGKDNQLIRMGRPKKQTINEALGGMKGGEAREGFLGTGNIVHKPDFVSQETLSSTEKMRKKHLQVILGQVIEPNAISSKSSPAMDRRSLVTKLGKSTLAELLRLTPDSLKTMSHEELEQIASDAKSLEEDVKADMQNLYLDVSP